MGCNKNLTDDQLEAMFTATDDECDRLSNQWNVWLKKTNARGVPDFSQTKPPSSNTTTNLPSKRWNALTAVKPSLVLITWRNTWEVVRRLLDTLANWNYVKKIWMDPPYWKMDPQHLRNWWWRKCKWVVHLLITLNIETHLKL